MTEDLFREDAYLKTTEARITAMTPDGVVLDRTVFYAQGGGQPGDTGTLETADGRGLSVTNTVYGETRQEIVHLLADASGLSVGDTVTVRLDWDRRHRLMRAHTCLHLLSVALPYPVTGGSVGEAEGRLDFDIPEMDADKDTLTAKLNEMIATDAAVCHRWITDAELDANPGLVKTMSVQPPRGTGRVRLVEIEGLDLQPCGGTHVARTGEIGRAEIVKIEKKGKINRRVRVALV